MTDFGIPFEYILFGGGLLLLLSVFASKISDRFGVPALLLFLIIGMLAGENGPIGILFDNLQLARAIGIIALIFIIFSGGLDTNWKETNTVLWPGVSLATLGVLLTAVIFGCAAMIILRLTFLEGLLLGSIVSSTDAAAVFSILRSRKVNLKETLRPLIEFESGSNDPMAIFLTLGVLHLLNEKITSLQYLLPMFFSEMATGGIIGYLMAKASILIINNLRLDYRGLYPSLTIALVILTYSLATLLNGNGFLSVYVLGLIVGNNDILRKKTIIHFHEGFAWLMQITMFLTLGLLVTPKQLLPIMVPGLILSLILMLIARPASVLLCLLPARMNLRKKIMVSWIGLRGAAPIVLAIFPLIMNVPHARLMFNIVFFVVLSSILFQGTSIPAVAKMLKVGVPLSNRRYYPIEFEKMEGIDAELTDVIVPFNSIVSDEPLFQLKVPSSCLIALILREDKYIIPNGATIVKEGDIMLVLGKDKDIQKLQTALFQLKTSQTTGSADEPVENKQG